jgi:inosine/xanthosine triphosphate pyrophosphatase family protein
MNQIIVEGTGVVCSDWAEHDDLIGISRLVEKAAETDAPQGFIVGAFQMISTAEQVADDHGAYEQDIIDEYRRATGCEYPPVYRVKIVVEAQALTEEERNAWWERKRAPTPSAPPTTEPAS